MFAYKRPKFSSAEEPPAKRQKQQESSSSGMVGGEKFVQAITYLYTVY